MRSGSARNGAAGGAGGVTGGRGHGARDRDGTVTGDAGDAPGHGAAGDDSAGPVVRDAGEDARAPTLRAMRAVWLTMRDEDPPDRGLGVLLAAAREKAEAMRPQPTVWQRLLAAMRRPQMLALATALVLIGGAVLVTREAGERAPKVAQDDGQAGAGHRPVQPPAPAPPPSAPVRQIEERRAPTPTEDLAPTQEAAGRTANTTKADLETTRAVVERAAGKTHAASVARSAHTDRPTVPAKPGPVALETVPSRGALRERETVETPRPDEPKLEARAWNATGASGTEAGDPPAGPARPRPHGGGFAAPSGENRGKPGNDQPIQAASGAGRNGAGRNGAEDADTAANTEAAPPPVQPAGAAAEPAPSAGQLGRLYRQCEAAAKRGDCAEVRRVVGQIMQTDRGYRARVARGSAVAKCLAEGGR